MRFVRTGGSTTLRMPFRDESHSITSDLAERTHIAASRRHHVVFETKWRNSEDNTLQDFGVDEDAEEDNIPLAELMNRRKHV